VGRVQIDGCSLAFLGAHPHGTNPARTPFRIGLTPRNVGDDRRGTVRCLSLHPWRWHGFDFPTGAALFGQALSTKVASPGGAALSGLPPKLHGLLPLAA
jgi:hypothetical protein